VEGLARREGEEIQLQRAPSEKPIGERIEASPENRFRWPSRQQWIRGRNGRIGVLPHLNKPEKSFVKILDLSGLTEHLLDPFPLPAARTLFSHG
jgi:hypothetical protein